MKWRWRSSVLTSHNLIFILGFQRLSIFPSPTNIQRHTSTTDCRAPTQRQSLQRGPSHYLPATPDLRSGARPPDLVPTRQEKDCVHIGDGYEECCVRGGGERATNRVYDKTAAVKTNCRARYARATRDPTIFCWSLLLLQLKLFLGQL